MNARPCIAAAAGVGYASTILAANWAVSNLTPVPVGFGQAAPAGVLFAGLAFTLRDVLQEFAGKAWALAAIVVGTLVSLAVTDWVVLPGGVIALALASTTAFGFSELADMLIWTRLRTQGRIGLALLLSNTVGAVVDSALFLLLAFGSLQFFAGQMLGKTWVTLLFVAPVVAARRWGARRAAA